MTLAKSKYRLTCSVAMEVNMAWPLDLEMTADVARERALLRMFVLGKAA